MRIAQDKRSAVLGRLQMFFLKINQRGEAALKPPARQTRKGGSDVAPVSRPAVVWASTPAFLRGHILIKFA
jgi:hypothetical protein